MTHRIASQAAPTDGCPACVNHYLPASLSVPTRDERDRPDGVVGFYTCLCGHSWWTSWGLPPASPEESAA